jgi:hypothetical protein
MPRVITTTTFLALWLMAFLVSACQPIQPVAATAAVECTDADKLKLLRTYEERFRNDDAAGVAALFTEDGVFAFDPAPRLNPESGEYYVPFVAHVEGRQQIEEMFTLLNSLDADVVFDTMRVQEDTVVAYAKQSSSLAPEYGQPTTEISGTQIIVVRDCQIATARLVLAQEALDALPAAEQAANAQCADDYKVAVFMRYLNGINGSDVSLAALPWADDAQAEFERAPELDAATQSYRSPDPLQVQGIDEIKGIINAFIGIPLYKTVDRSSVVVNGSTLTMNVTLSSPSFTGEPWLLPVEAIEGGYTVTFNDQCKVATVKWALVEGTADQLTALKQKQ